MCRARLLLLLVAVCSRRGGPNYGAVRAADDPVLNKLRSQLMANNYDYEESESIEKALRVGGAQDAAPRTGERAEERANGNVISDESELSDFGLDRNVLNGYITDMSDINVKPVPRANDDTFTGDGQEADAAQNVDELSESEPELAPPEDLSAEPAPGGQALPERAQQATPLLPQPAVKQLQPTLTPAKHLQPELAPVKRSEPEPEPEDELSQPPQVAEELSQGAPSPQQQAAPPVQWSQPRPGAPPAPQQIHVVSPYLAGQQTTEAIPYKVLTGRGQKQGRRSGAGVVSYLQTQLNGTVVVAPLGPGPMPDFQLPRGRRQYREISEDEDQEEEIINSK